MAGNKVEKISEAVTVKAQLITGITLSPAKVVLTVGESANVTATILPTNASNKNLTWTSNNSGIASVSNGQVTGKALGTTTITATANDGSGVSATCEVNVVTADSALKVLGEAKYVNYVDGTGKTRLCAVLYDKNSPYGVEITTMEYIEEIEIGNGTGSDDFLEDQNYFDIAVASYNNAITTLNNATTKYINSTYVDRSRSIGSLPSNPSYEAGLYYNYDSKDGFFTPYNGLFKGPDNNSVEDKEQLDKLEISGDEDWNFLGYSQGYWLASRYLRSDRDDDISFDIDAISWTYGTLVGVDWWDTHITSRSWTRGLRPVFHLKPEVRVTGGNGTKENPYTLGV